jgi:hypothetical protein
LWFIGFPECILFFRFYPLIANGKVHATRIGWETISPAVQKLAHKARVVRCTAKSVPMPRQSSSFLIMPSAPPTLPSFHPSTLPFFQSGHEMGCEMVVVMKIKTILPILVAASAFLGMAAQADEIQFTTLPQPVQTTVIRETHISDPTAVTRVVQDPNGIYAVTVHGETGERRYAHTAL